MTYFLFVKDVYLLHGSAGTVAEESAPLKDIIRIYAEQPGTRGVFLVDEYRRFSGMVSRLAIQKWAEYQLFGKWQGDESCHGINEMIDSVKAKDVAHGNWSSLALKTDDPLETAFKRMIDLGEDILPVVDDKGRIIGDLSLSEVLEKAIEAGGCA